VEGSIVNNVRSEFESMDVRVTVNQNERPEDALKNLSALNATGELVPLTSLIRKIPAENGAFSIEHYKGRRSITVYADITEDITTPGLVNKSMEAYFPEWKKSYPGLQITALGGKRDTQESMDSLKRSAMIALAGVLFVMILTLGSLWQPLVVFSSVPMGLAGVIFIFLIHGRPLSFLALFGIVGLIGVAVNVGIVLIDRINTLSKTMSWEEALIEGSVQRCRAVLLTSITTVFGLMPTAYGWGGGDPFLKPMALALGWGIAFSTILGIVLIPVYLAVLKSWVNFFRSKYRRIFHKKARLVSVPPNSDQAAF